MNSNAHNNIEVEQEMKFSPSYRWQHWIRVFAIIALMITGFYIAVPFITPAVNAQPTNFLQSLIRSWHIIFGFILITVVIFKIYITLFTKECKKERDSLKDVFNIKVWVQQIGYYLLMAKHPKAKGVYNPVQFVAYLALYVMIFGLILTGLMLYVNVFHEGLGGFMYEPMRAMEEAMGGLAVVRTVHHLLAWGVLIFVLAHVYMVIFNAIYGKEGGLDAIVSGLSWHKKD